MSETTVSQTPLYDDILSKLPKETRSMWLSYLESRPDLRTDLLTEKHRFTEGTCTLAHLTTDGANDISTFPDTVVPSELRNIAFTEVLNLSEKLTTFQKLTEIGPSLAGLKMLEESCARRRAKVQILESERSLGDDASRTLEEEIVRNREAVTLAGKWTRSTSELVLGMAIRKGFIIQESKT
ncbi:MAG: hypothetical protein Q9168_002966 [Polycauliona sp. 1 TL-2023]